MRVNVAIDVPDALLHAAGPVPSAGFWQSRVAHTAATAMQPPDRIERGGRAPIDGLRALALCRGASVRRMRYVHHGALRVPISADAQFRLAERYLSRDVVMRHVIARVEHARSEYTLRIVHDDNDRYEPSTRTIDWDPHSALRTTTGGRQSPALGLGHEMDHAVEPWRRRDALQAHRLPAFDNAEERRVIRGSERQAALSLREGVRNDHRGTCFSVPSPIGR